MAIYRFQTTWELPYPVASVWSEIYQMDQWPVWWKHVRSVEKIKTGDANEIGSVRRIVWTTALPYTISFDTELTYLQIFERMEGIAKGDLTGRGIWRFENSGHGTRVIYDWEVVTTKKWMQYFDWVARPVFTWNHDQVMKSGYTGLQKRLHQKTNETHE